MNSLVDQHATTGRNEQVTTTRIRVLIVEDNAADARYLEEILNESRAPLFEYTFAEDLASAQAILSSSSFDVILLDLSLPDASGLDTVRRIRHAAARTPCIVLTGNQDERLALAAVQAGAQDYLEKGREDVRSLTRSIRYAIERRKAEEEALARAHAEESARQARLLADATRVLSESLDVDRTLRALTRLAVQALGDYGWVELVEGDCIRRVVTESRDPEPHLEDVLRFAPRRELRGHPTVEALDTGRTVVRDVSTPAARAALATSEEHLRLVDLLAPGSLVAVPLRTRATAMGVVTIVRRASRAPFTTAELAFAEDLASRSALAVENAQVHLAAQRAALARERMVAIVSHDLRNPLSIVSLSLQRLRAKPELLESGGGSVLLDRAQRALTQTARLLDDLLEVARLDAGAVKVSREPLSPAEFVQETADLHRALADEKSIRLDVEIEPGLPEITADRERLAQIFANLIGNALKFTAAERRVTIGARSGVTCVRFFVRDEGPGIAPDHLPHLFERFYRTPDANQKGYGLGLAIARGLVEAHGGRIWAESAVGVGTTMSFEIPC